MIHPLKFRACALLLLIALTPTLPAAVERTFHVAPPPLGADNADGSAAQPFATLDRARLAARAYLAAHDLRGDLVVELRAGSYALTAPVRFDAADSGENGFNVVYRAAPGATVLLDGGRAITGWTREADGVYRAEVGRDVDFRQLWIDDRRAIRARTPNLGLTYTFAAEKQSDGFDIPRAQLAGLTLRPNEIEFSVLIAWMHKRLRLARTADTADTADTAAPDITRAVIAPGDWDAVVNQPQGDRIYLDRHYWLENAREFLDAPGEFFLDRTAGLLRYRPRPGENLSTARVVRPELENLIVLAGRPDAPVHHLRFEGFTFAHTGWTRPNRHGFVDVQANSLVPADLAAAVDPQYRHDQRKDRIPAAFQAETADHIVVRGNRFARLGGAGVVFTHGGNDNIIEGNSFFDLAAGGIELGEDAARPTNPRLFPRRNRIANNFLAHLGEDYFGSVAILGYYTDASLITHNEIVAVPYTPISQGWGWGKPSGPTDARANRITHNRVSNFLRRLDDGGGLYTTDRQLGSEISHNYVERMLPPDDRKKAGAALYPDQFTEGTHWHHNVVAEVPRWLHLWNPNIRDNRLDNNFADTAAHRNDGPDNIVEPVHLVADRRWPEPARAIIAAAGLEPAFASVRALAAPAEVIVPSTSVDFQILTGTWHAADTAPDRYGATIQHSADPTTSARWTPILPRTGDYEVSVWLLAGATAAHYTIRHATGETHVTLSSATTAPARWHPLGRFTFAAGADSTVTVTATTPGLIADTVRWSPTRP